MDGADWLQSRVDLHRPDALRILDFPHAVQQLSAIVEARQQAGKALLAAWAVIQRHQLKEEGPAAVLQDIEQVQTEAPEVQEHLRYLRKREALMQYPSYQQQGWPIGSGMVESGNK